MLPILIPLLLIKWAVAWVANSGLNDVNCMLAGMLMGTLLGGGILFLIMWLFPYPPGFY